jgi:hypothetical protein
MFAASLFASGDGGTGPIIAGGGRGAFVGAWAELMFVAPHAITPTIAQMNMVLFFMPPPFASLDATLTLSVLTCATRNLSGLFRLDLEEEKKGPEKSPALSHPENESLN